MTMRWRSATWAKVSGGVLLLAAVAGAPKSLKRRYFQWALL